MNTVPKRDPFQRMMDRMEEAFKSFQEVETILGQDALPNAQLPVDVTDAGDELIVTADLPGVQQDNIAVQATTNAVTISAHDERELAHEEHEYERRERSARQYQRQIALPARIDPDSAEASYENGVLTVRLAKADDSDQRDVPINSP